MTGPAAPPLPRRSGLRREITRSMAATVMVVVAGILSSSYLVYWLLMRLYPQWDPTQDVTPTPLEWVWMVLVTLTSLALAVGVSVLLTRRILAPLHSVADALRRVAMGDLSVRAVAGDRAPGETAALVDDFNAMARRFEQMQHDIDFWNAAIAHELRTPLTILRGRLQGLADGVFSPEERQFRSLLVQVEGLSRLVEDLRALSLAEGGRLELHAEPVDLLALVQAVAELYAPALADAGGTLAVQLPAAPLTVRCDAVRIRQALLALLDNARRHAMPSPVWLQLQVRPGEVVLAVEDDGPGIDPAHATRIFEPFTRAAPAPAARGSSGLGLAVVRAIAHAHGGHVGCVPGTTGGARFEMRWPVA